MNLNYLYICPPSSEIWPKNMLKTSFLLKWVFHAKINNQNKTCMYGKKSIKKYQLENLTGCNTQQQKYPNRDYSKRFLHSLGIHNRVCSFCSLLTPWKHRANLRSCLTGWRWNLQVDLKESHGFPLFSFITYILM